MNATPIFIVGVQRSGTTLLAAMLAAHSRLSCGPETHFFRRLAQVDASRLCDPATWPGPAIDFLSSISHTGFVSSERTTLLDKYRVTPASVAASLRGGPPSIARALASITVPYMTTRGKQRWVEKTPDHLLHGPAIRRHFPQSPIIRIVRDPRDVAQSLLRVPWGVKSLVEGLLYWQRMDDQSRAFFAQDAQTVTVRFEDLVEAPTKTLQTICAAIGETFEAGMLDTSQTGAEINTRGVPWKHKVSQAPDSSRIAAWRTELTVRDNQMAEALLGDRLHAFGYPQQATFSKVGELRPGPMTGARYQDALGLLASDGVRFWRRSGNEKVDLTIYLGDPGSSEWNAPASVSGQGCSVPTVAVLRDLLRARLQRSRVCWIPAGDGQWMGCRSYVLRRLLAPFRLNADERSAAAVHP